MAQDDRSAAVRTLLAVDRQGRRRGWYTGTDEVQLERLKRRMLFLAGEPR